MSVAEHNKKEVERKQLNLLSYSYSSQLFMQGEKEIQWDVDNSLFLIFGVGQQACT